MNPLESNRRITPRSLSFQYRTPRKCVRAKRKIAINHKGLKYGIGYKREIIVELRFFTGGFRPRGKYIAVKFMEQGPELTSGYDHLLTMSLCEINWTLSNIQVNDYIYPLRKQFLQIASLFYEMEWYTWTYQLSRTTVRLTKILNIDLNSKVPTLWQITIIAYCQYVVLIKLTITYSTIVHGYPVVILGIGHRPW